MPPISSSWLSVAHDRVFFRNSVACRIRKLIQPAFVFTAAFLFGAPTLPVAQAATDTPAGLADNAQPKTVSAPSWSTLPLGGGGYVTGLVSDPTGADIYGRSDCGGAFKWNAAKAQWDSITDTIVPTSDVNSNAAMSISSIAVDPNQPNQLYVAVGDFVWAAIHGIFSSNDKGAHWTQINSSIIMNGQGAFRTCGERLQVDPNNSNIIWFGSTQDGLQKGVFSTGKWTWTQVPAAAVPFGAVASGDKAGITFVACDKNGGRTIVYAGVFDSVGSTGGIYMSVDGTNWSKVPGIALATPGRGQLASNGTLYVTQSGIVAQMPRGGELQAITPEAGVGYLGLAIDPNDSTGNTLYVAEASTGTMGKIYRTVDGGKTWAQQSRNFNNQDYTRTEPDGTPSLTGYWFGETSSLLVSPKNPNELWAGDFFGVARTEDAEDLGTTNGALWHMLQKNQEQTCVAALLNAPTGAQLMVGQCDVGGFRYLNTAARPFGADGSAFANPAGGSNPGLDFSEHDNNVWARTWNNPFLSGGSGAVSGDGGVTWVKFGELGEQKVANSDTAGWVTYDVGTYMAKQKARGNNTVTLVLCCDNSINPLWSTGAIIFDSKESDAANAPQLLVNGKTSLVATADAYVGGSDPSANYGSEKDLEVSYKYDSIKDRRWVYLKFDLSSVDAITSATLRLHQPNTTDSTSWMLGIYACANASWDESTITWANKPGILASNVDPIESPQYMDGTTPLCGGRIAVSSTDPNIMVWLPQGSGTLPRYSNDRGVSWTVCTGAPESQMKSRDNPGTLIQQLAADRVNGKFYLAEFAGAKGYNHAIYSSSDGGVTWTSVGTIPTGWDNIYRCQIVAAPAANDVWVCDDGQGKTPPTGGIWHSTDGGAIWSQVASEVISQVRVVSFGKAQSKDGYTVFIAGYKNGTKGIYRSDDQGATWVALAPLPTGADIDTMAGDRQNYGKVFFGTRGRGAFQGQ